ncbi:hypothetical protein [Burkholderia pyrrocinia]|nr:hypothetical protein [Burkholderia pyrrocinia]
MIAPDRRSVRLAAIATAGPDDAAAAALLPNDDRAAGDSTDIRSIPCM